MDFLKAIIEGMASEDGDTDDDSGAVFEHAVKAANKAVRELVAQSKQYANEGDYFKASLFLFTCAWAIAGHIYGGVADTNRKKGPDNLVNKLWQLLRVAFMSGPLDRTMKKLGTFETDFDEGKYND